MTLETLKFRLINLETLKLLHYFFRDWGYLLILLETLLFLAYSFRDTKSFALLIEFL